MPQSGCSPQGRMLDAPRMHVPWYWGALPGPPAPPCLQERLRAAYVQQIDHHASSMLMSGFATTRAQKQSKHIQAVLWVVTCFVARKQDQVWRRKKQHCQPAAPQGVQSPKPTLQSPLQPVHAPCAKVCKRHTMPHRVAPCRLRGGSCQRGRPPPTAHSCAPPPTHKHGQKASKLLHFSCIKPNRLGTTLPTQ